MASHRPCEISLGSSSDFAPALFCRFEQRLIVFRDEDEIVCVAEMMAFRRAHRLRSSLRCRAFSVMFLQRWDSFFIDIFCLARQLPACILQYFECWYSDFADDGSQSHSDESPIIPGA